jgi:hypothetical protein
MLSMMRPSDATSYQQGLVTGAPSSRTVATTA